MSHGKCGRPASESRQQIVGRNDEASALDARHRRRCVGCSDTGCGRPWKRGRDTVQGNLPVGTATFTCSGAHVVTKNFIKDSQTCLVTGDTTGYVAGTYSGSPAGFVPPCGICFWQSDFNGAIATSWALTVTNNGDGTFTIDALSFYAP